jgi:serine/threonine protein kinase
MSRFHSKSYKKYNQRFHSVDEFDIIGELGKGGYSVVYLVRHKNTGRKYALKCAMKYKKGKDRSDRTLQEIDVLSGLRHRGVIRLRGWFENEDNIYLVLQYVSGRDLSKFFRKDLPSRENAANIILQIVDALKYCHRHNIIHRDLKLENILIDKKLRIRLTDFGLCAIKERESQYFFDEVGTARYTSPELLDGGGYNESVDVWGIGIILFILLTGKYPFDGSKRKSIFRRIRNKHIDYSRYDLSRDEVHLLKRLLCKNPRYRIQLDDIPYHEWFKKHSDSDSYSSE